VRRGTRYIPLILLIAVSVARSEVTDTLTTRYSQELDTRVWRLQTRFHSKEAAWRSWATASEEVTNRSLPGFAPQWKNELVVRMQAQRPAGEALTLLLESQGQDYRDRAAKPILEKGETSPLPSINGLPPVSAGLPAGEDTRITRGAIRSGAMWQSDRQFEIHLLGGGSTDRQSQGEGSGLSSRGGFDFQPDLNNPFRLQGEGWLDTYGARRNHQALLTASATQSFGEASDRIDVRWINRRNDMFLGRSNSVASRLNDEIMITNSLLTPLAERTTGMYDIQYRKTVVEYSGSNLGEGRELDFINRFSLRTDRGRMFSDLSYSYAVEDRHYGGSLILGRRQVLQLAAGWTDHADTLHFSYTAQKLSHDSPDTLEQSDRDRLIHSLRHESAFWLMEDTRLKVEALVLLDHLVNLSSARSSDNRWNRVFRLSPSVDYLPANGWRNSIRFEVLANYNVYDFEEPSSAASLRSNALRRWSASDTLTIPIAHLWGAELTSRYDLEDRGRLRWKEFVQELSDEANAYYGSASLQWLVWTRWTISVGYRYQERNEDRFERDPSGKTIRIPARSYLARGPLLRVQTVRWSRLQSAVDASFLTVHDSTRDDPIRHDSVFITLLYSW